MKNITWRTEKRKLADLVPASYNPRKLTEKQYSNLKESLEKFGLAEIPAINTDNLVLAGHQRLKVLTDLFGKDYEIDVRVPNRKLTDAEAKEYNIRSNKNTGEWDWDILGNHYDMEELLSFGFQEFELGGLGASVEKDINELSDGLESYLQGNIKQIVLYFKGDEFEPIIDRMQTVMNKESLETHTDAFLKLLEFYESNHS
jgi:ParB-like chromosome segregation protein Spo0J